MYIRNYVGKLQSMGLEHGAVGQDFLEGFLVANANGHSGGVVTAWNDMVFSKVDSRMGQFSAAVKLKRHSNNLEVVMVSIYGPANFTQTELWRELREVAAVLHGSPKFVGGDFNVTLEAR